jgi:hypothetical protein
MVNRTTSLSKRIQHTLPREARDAVSSGLVSFENISQLNKSDLLEKVLLSLNCVLNRMTEVVGGGMFDVKASLSLSLQCFRLPLCTLCVTTLM